MKNNIPHNPLFVFAHPDDEVLGASSLLDKYGEDARVVFITDGMPPKDEDPEYYPPHTSFPDYGSEYAAMRRNEAIKALSVFGVARERIFFLDSTDTKLIDDIEKCRKILEELFATLNPSMIITHAYEGGHIDHDLTCLIVNLILHNLRSIVRAVLMEAYIYNYEDGKYNHNRRLSSCLCPIQIALADNHKIQKQMALSHYSSQESDIQHFDPSARENFRDWVDVPHLGRFLEPPHSGILQYELSSSGVKFSDFQKAVRRYL